MNSFRAGSSMLRNVVSNNLRRSRASAIRSAVKHQQPQRAMSNYEHDGQQHQVPAVQDEQEKPDTTVSNNITEQEEIDITVSNDNEQVSEEAQASSEGAQEGRLDENGKMVFSEDLEKEREWVDMWNKDAPNGPEWSGPRGYEPTRYGDWARNGRVSDF